MILAGNITTFIGGVATDTEYGLLCINWSQIKSITKENDTDFTLITYYSGEVSRLEEDYSHVITIIAKKNRINILNVEDFKTHCVGFDDSIYYK